MTKLVTFVWAAGVYVKGCMFDIPALDKPGKEVFLISNPHIKERRKNWIQ